MIVEQNISMPILRFKYIFSRFHFQGEQSRRKLIIYLNILNKFIMQSLKVIPRVIAKIQGLQKYNDLSPDKMLAQYKQNFKIFVETMTQQVTQLIDNYQLKIQQLTNQLENLRQNINQSEIISPLKKRPTSNNKTPLHNFNKFMEVDMMQTVRSNLFASKQKNFRSEELFPGFEHQEQKHKKQNKYPIQVLNNSPLNSSDLQENNSRFLTRSKIKKQKQSELMHYLDAGSKNIQKTTKIFMSIIRRDNQQADQPTDNLFKQQRSESTKSIKLDISNNKSLSSICESLESSYQSRKARSRNMKKKEQELEEIKRRQKHNEEVTKILKDRGVKNLLQKLRNNAQNSTNPQEIIKNSKLISCSKGNAANFGQNVKSTSFSQKRNSKVMINPIPIDLEQKSKARSHQNTSCTLSPERKPNSILKNSSVLTRSLLGISAIELI